MTVSVDIPELARSFCCWGDKDNKLSLDHGSRKSDTIIPFTFLLGRKMPWPLRVHTFLRLSLAENVLSSYVIIMICLWSGLLTAQSSGYSFGTIVPSSKKPTKYGRSDFISLRNVSRYSITSSRSCPSKNTLFCTSFHLYPKRWSHFWAVFERILARRSISPFSHTLLPAKIDCSSPSGVSSSSCASSGRFACKYPFTNWAKEYEVIPNILLTRLIGKH